MSHVIQSKATECSSQVNEMGKLDSTVQDWCPGCGKFEIILFILLGFLDFNLFVILRQAYIESMLQLTYWRYSFEFSKEYIWEWCVSEMFDHWQYLLVSGIMCAKWTNSAQSKRSHETLDSA